MKRRNSSARDCLPKPYESATGGIVTIFLLCFRKSALARVEKYQPTSPPPDGVGVAISLRCSLDLWLVPSVGREPQARSCPLRPGGSAGAGEASHCRCPCDLVSSRFSQSSSLTFGGGKDRGRSSPVTPRLRRSCRRKHLPTPLLSFRRSRARLSPLGASGAFFLLL